MQHIQITTETCSPSDGSDSPHAHAVWKFQGGGELPDGRAQTSEAHPELMQRLWVAVSEHLGLQVAQAAGLTPNELQGELSTGERRFPMCVQGSHRFMQSWSHRRYG